MTHTVTVAIPMTHMATVDTLPMIHTDMVATVVTQHTIHTDTVAILTIHMATLMIHITTLPMIHIWLINMRSSMEPSL